MSLLTKLYPYQKEAVEAIYGASKGIIVLPTSTGKTFCQAASMIMDIHDYPNQFRLYVVNAPRILLTYQLFVEVYIPDNVYYKPEEYSKIEAQLHAEADDFFRLLIEGIKE
jgi:hypothetical protein